jgi:hypothetical protein
MVDRDGVAVDIGLDTEGAAMSSLERGVTSPRLSAIVLGPLMIVYVEMYLALRWIFGKSSREMSYSL